MADDVPHHLTLAATFQLVSGLVNFALLPLILIAGAELCGTLTYGVGSICALGIFVVGPVGLLEIGVALFAFTAPKEAAPWQRWVTWAELLAVAGGSFHAGIVGWVVAQLLERPDVVAYLEDRELDPWF